MYVCGSLRVFQGRRGTDNGKEHRQPGAACVSVPGPQERGPVAGGGGGLSGGGLAGGGLGGGGGDAVHPSSSTGVHRSHQPFCGAVHPSCKSTAHQLPPCAAASSVVHPRYNFPPYIHVSLHLHPLRVICGGQPRDAPRSGGGGGEAAPPPPPPSSTSAAAGGGFTA